jgi:hypothetical protein
MSLKDINKQIEKEYQEYLSKLNNVEKIKHFNESNDFNNSFNIFWEKEYPNLSFEEKKRYWLASTHKGMRTQGEALGDEYSEFSKGWLEFAKENEPKFDEIFKYVTENLGFEFDWKEFNKRIKK